MLAQVESIDIQRDTSDEVINDSKDILPEA